MTLPDLKQLEKIIKLCRKQGITYIKIDGIELSLNETTRPVTRKRKGKTAKEFEPLVQEEVESDEPTPEELMFWSAGGVSEQN